MHVVMYIELFGVNLNSKNGENSKQVAKNRDATMYLYQTKGVPSPTLMKARGGYPSKNCVYSKMLNHDLFLSLFKPKNLNVAAPYKNLGRFSNHFSGSRLNGRILENRF